MKTVISILKAKFYDPLDEHMMEVVRSAGITFIIKVASAGFAFGFNVLLARLLGADSAGIYFLALTLTTIAATIGRFGLDNSLLRFVATHAAKLEWSQVKGVFRKGILISFSVSFFMSVLQFVIAPILASQIFNKPELEPPLRLMALAVVPFSIYWLIAEGLKGLKKIRDSQLIQGLALPVLTCLGLALIGGESGAAGAAVIFVIGTFLVLLWGGILWRRATSYYFQEISPAFPVKKILTSCVPLLWVQLMYMVMNWSSVLMLGIWGSKAEVGIFGAASRTAMLTSFILVSVNSIVAPKFATLYAKEDKESLASLARMSTKMMITFAAPILLMFIFAPKLVMQIFGIEFSSGSDFLVIMAIGQFINVATGSVGYLLIMTGHEQLMRNNTLIVGCFSLLLNLILISQFGGLGAALSTAISMSLINIGALFLVWKKLGIWTFPMEIKAKI